MLVLVWISLALALDPASVGALPSTSASARLDQLIAARDLDPAGLEALAPAHPEVVWQLVDVQKRAALEYVLALPPAEIRRVRDGQTVVRTGDGGAAFDALCDAAGLSARKVTGVTVRTRDAQLVRVELSTKKESVVVDLAFPADAARADAVAAVEAWLGRPLPRVERAGLVDPGFEDPESLGLAWIPASHAGGRVTRDTARAVAGKACVRLESDAPSRDGVVISQRLDAHPGDALTLALRAAPDGLVGPASAELLFLDAGGTALYGPDPARVDPADTAWQSLAVAGTVPALATESWIVLGLWGAGAVHFDDLRLAVGGEEPAAARTWARFPHGTVVVRADPTRVAAPADVAAGVDRVLVSAATRLGITLGDTLSVYVVPPDDHSPHPDDPARGVCWQSADDPVPGGCVVRATAQRAWGAPGNAFIAEGLSRALGSSGVDLDAAARPHLAGTGPLARLAWDGSEGQRAVAASFVAWLLRTQGAPAVRAAWSARSLEGFAVAGQDLAALERAWRAASEAR